MPAPSTTDEFLELVRKSGVIDDKRLAAHIDRLRGAGQLPTAPHGLAIQLVRDGVLTHFQAEQFLQGKWRRFTIGKYKVLERLGQGGMGSVYLCEHMLMRRRVAVKVLPESRSADNSSLERFYREARCVAALDHPNIVRAYDIDQDDKLHFLVMEHVDGASLQEIIKRSGPMDVIRAAHYTRQAALGLQHAHDAAGLVHRDIKPGNILVDRNGIVKVLDMGLARFFHDEEDILTKKYDEHVLGTADYLAPEQALDSHTVDIRADIYSLGATFYFCLTGRTPFAEGTVAQKLIWHQTRQPKPIRSLRPEVPEGIVGIIDRMMAKDPAHRYQSPAEIADALAPWTQTPIGPPPESEMPQLSLAATGRGPGGFDSSLSSASRPASDPGSNRKSWQVSSPSTVGSPAATPSPSPVPPPRETRPAPAVAPRVAPVAAAPPRGDARATPAPTAANNGARVAPVVGTAVAQLAPADTPRPHEDLSDLPLTSPRPSQAPSPLAQLMRHPLLPLGVAVAGLGFLAAGAVIAYFVFFNGSPPTRTTVSAERGPIRIAAGDGAALRQALLRARKGDHIILQGDVTVADLRVEAADVTIEAEPGKQVVWRCPPTAGEGTKLLLIYGAAGLLLRNLTLDGANKAEALLVLSGHCPGARLDNLRLRGPKAYAIWVTNCEGSADARVRLTNLDLQTPEGAAALRFEVKSGLKVQKNRFLSVRGCTFEGRGRKVTAVAADHIDAATVELPDGWKVEVLAR